MKQTTNEDRHLERVRDEHFPNSDDRRWPLSGGQGWFKAPRALPVVLQILTEKGVVSRGNPGLAYLELLSRVREPGFVILEHPSEHARIVGYSRPRTWREAMQQLNELGLVETRKGHEREFAYALIVNPFIAVRRLHKAGKVTDALWNLFYEKWTKARAEIPVDDSLEETVSLKKKGAPASQASPRKTRSKRR